jgi:FtsH-binding integral membrane protein
MTFHPINAFFVFPIMLVLLELGRFFRNRPKAPSESKVIESAVFALFGLLLAFTFSSAIARYDTHRRLVVAEANGITTAYLRLDLLPSAAQPALRQLFRDYTTSRLHLYDAISEEVSPESQALQREIWKQSVAAASAPGASVDATKLLLPALNSMIEITAVRQNAFNMHPPPVVFLLLFVFSGGAAFLAGYSMTPSDRSWFHMFAFAVAVTLTIYATLEIEYPRQGLIRLANTDETLIELRNSMN